VRGVRGVAVQSVAGALWRRRILELSEWVADRDGRGRVRRVLVGIGLGLFVAV